MFFGSSYDYIKASENCSKFAEIMKKTTVMSKGSDNVTVFVPSNAAFDRLPDTALQDIQRDLEKFMSCHLYKGDLCTAGMYHISEFKSLDRSWSIDLNSNNELVIDGTAGMVEQDIVCTNGVVHVIDRVLWGNLHNNQRH